MSFQLDAELAAIVVCPDCHGTLEQRPAPTGAAAGGDVELVCTGCGLAYPVRDEIPVLLVDEARRPA